MKFDWRNTPKEVSKFTSQILNVKTLTRRCVLSQVWVLSSEYPNQIYERSIIRIEGLARLLVLEKLFDTNAREKFLSARRRLRGRPDQSSYRKYKKTLKGDLKADTAIGGLEMNDYDVASLHIPYGPGWDARRIDKLIYQTVRILFCSSREEMLIQMNC